MTKKSDTPISQRVENGFYTAIDEYDMLSFFSSGVLLALSGGADSVVLFHLMKRLSLEKGFFLKVLHVNHMIRGDEAERDMNFCIQLARELQTEISVVKENIPEIAKSKGIGLEEAARSVRYSAFEAELAVDGRLSCIVTAHNASDNAETVIFNLLRGSGSAAMSGIPVVRSNILRPLINISKTDILEYARENGLQYVTDSTNGDPSYTRNFIRMKILPHMREIFPNADASFSKMCSNIRLDSEFMESYSNNIIEENKISSKASRKVLKTLHKSIFFRVLKHMFAEAGGDLSLYDRQKNEAAYSLIFSDKQNFEIAFGGGLCFFCERDVCAFSKKCEAVPEYSVKLNLGYNRIDEVGAVIYLSDLPNCEFEASNSANYLIYKAVIYAEKGLPQLYARKRRDGDAYCYGKITHKIKKIYNDRKVRIGLREALPIICDDKGIIWVPGFPVRDGASEKKFEYKLYVYLCVNDGKYD